MIDEVTRIDTSPAHLEPVGPPMPIGSLLIESGHLTHEQLDRVLLEQKRRRRRFGELTVKMGFAPQGAVDGALARQFGYPTARSTRGSRLPDGLVTAQNPNLPFAEAMRAMRGQLLQRWFTGAHDQSAMAVASVDQGDGKSFLCANLAVVFAQLGESTLVIDADLRNPSQQKIFSLRNRMGLSGVLSGRAGLSEVRRMRSLPNLSILPAGATPPNPQELLSRGTFRRVLKEMAVHFDVILIDTPAAQIASDVQVVTQRAGSALLVARKDHTRAPELTRLAASLSGTGARILGSTLNDY